MSWKSVSGMAIAAATLVLLGAVNTARADAYYTPAEIKRIAHELANEVGIPADKQGDLWARLGAAIDDPAFFASRPRCNGVIVYRRGGGGFIVKVQKGHAIGRFHGKAQKAAVNLKQVSYGAQIGGGTEYGVALVLGLGDLAHFGGEYTGGTRGGTMGKASMSITELTKKGSVGTPMFHKLYLIGTGAGASADAGGASVTVQLLNWF